MRDSRLPGKEPTSGGTVHLAEATLEQLAEGTLPDHEEAGALAHLEHCVRCAGELDAYRALFAALEGLPRFAPADGFSDAVLARIHIGPRESPVLAQLRRWLPQTHRGWMLLAAALVAPALPLLAAAVWLLTHPLVTPMSLAQWAGLQLQQGGQMVLGQVLAWSASSGLVAQAQAAYAALSSVPLVTLGIVLGILAVAIPLSAWSLIRLTRTPMGKITYAN